MWELSPPKPRRSTFSTHTFSAYLAVHHASSSTHKTKVRKMTAGLWRKFLIIVIGVVVSSSSARWWNAWKWCPRLCGSHNCRVCWRCRMRRSELKFLKSFGVDRQVTTDSGNNWFRCSNNLVTNHRCDSVDSQETTLPGVPRCWATPPWSQATCKGPLW